MTRPPQHTIFAPSHPGDPMIRTLIVDDELYAREELMQHLAAEPDIELLGTAANAIEALPLIQRLKARRGVSRHPDAQLSGMELVAMLDPLPASSSSPPSTTTPSRRSRRTPSTTCSSRWSRRASPRRLGDSRQDITPATGRKPGPDHPPYPRLPAQPGAAAAHRTGGVRLLRSRRRARRQPGRAVSHPAHPQVLEEKTPLLRCHRQYLIAPTPSSRSGCWTTSWRR